MAGSPRPRRLKSVESSQESRAGVTPLPRRWGWLGLANKTVWDVVQLLSVPIVLLLGIAYLTHRITQQLNGVVASQQEIAESQYQRDRLRLYREQTTDALISKDLRSSPADSEMRTLLKANTFSALRELNPDHKAELVQFLYDADLITTAQPIVSLERADLTGANLSQAPLNSIMLNGVSLSEADLSYASLSSANLDGTDLRSADLTGAFLSQASMKGSLLQDAALDGADLTGANLGYALLSHATLTDANLTNVVLNGATLSHADLTGAIVSELSFRYVFLCRTTMPDGSISDRDCPS